MSIVYGVFAKIKSIVLQKNIKIKTAIQDMVYVICQF